MDDDLLDPALMEDAEEIGDEEEFDVDGLPKKPDTDKVNEGDDEEDEDEM